MVITVTCPACSSSFPVDPAKVPPKGVNARCSTCGEIFRVERPAPAPAPEVPAPQEPPPLPASATPRSAFYDEPDAVETASSLEQVQVVPSPPEPEPSSPEPAPAEPAPSPPASEAATPAAQEPGFRFGKRDPTDKAKRLARVLVSDMIMYNAERHKTALEKGTLQEDFDDEIDKSWKEFVEQVGSEIAEGPGRAFWSDALNDILAKGQKIF
jgi:predicted Zn finger-like uncharacterized protein